MIPDVRIDHSTDVNQTEEVRPDGCVHPSGRVVAERVSPRERRGSRHGLLHMNNPARPGVASHLRFRWTGDPRTWQLGV